MYRSIPQLSVGYTPCGGMIPTHATKFTLARGQHIWGTHFCGWQSSIGANL